MKLIQLGDYYFNLERIAAFRASTLDKDQTIVFTQGQSAADAGFLVDLPVDEVLEELEKARLIEVGLSTELQEDV